MPACRFRIDIRNQSLEFGVSTAGIKASAKKILKALGFHSAALSILLVDDRTMRVYNRKHLRHDRPTDVMAFSHLEGKKIAACPQTVCYLGDILISPETARRQSQEYDHSFQDEVLLYLCHGILHLTGWCDATRRERLGMERKQRLILKKIATGKRGGGHGHSKD